MKRIYTKAFNALKKLGVPVYEHVDDDGNFSINAEAVGATDWVDYYDGIYLWADTINPKIEDVLRANRLYAEWVNPGRLAVYPA